MRKLVLLFFLFTIPIFTFSQNISVKSFRILEADMSARIDFPKVDQNGEKAALIKVVTTQTGFEFDGGSLGIVSVERKTGEYWVYVPRGAKAITIKHDKLGIIRNYAYPISIVAATVYELELITGTVETTVKPIEVVTQWLAINSKPEGASVFIEEQLVGTTPFSRKYPEGDYTYRLELPRYHTQAGKVSLAGEKKVLELTLKPNFGIIKVTSLPESGMTIYLNDQNTNKITPATLEGIASGEQTIKLISQWYQPQTKRVMVTDEQTITADFIMNPAFADITVNTSPTANITVDDKSVGIGTYTARMLAGIYTIKADKEKHYTDQQQVTVVAGNKKSINLELKPISGTLDVASTPFVATITIDGKDYGTTPNTIKNLLVGDYTLTIKKVGYGTITKTITIKENATTEVNEKLPTGMEVTLISTPAGAQLYLDNYFAGSTPYTTTLSFGSHTVKLVNGKKVVEEMITVSQNGKTRFEYNAAEVLTDIEGNTYKTVTIGTQEWMAENLRTTKYSDGSPIQNITKDSKWHSQNSGAYCWYNIEVSNKASYGVMYNWYAVVDSRRLCPSGWHVPTDTELTTLETYLGGSKVAGGKLKATTLWVSPNTGATNSSGFTAFPGGYRGSNFGEYNYIGFNCTLWSSTEANAAYAWFRFLFYNSSEIIRNNYDKRVGMSVRCVKD